MRKRQVEKVMIFDQMWAGKEHPVFFQLLAKAGELFRDRKPEFIRVAGDGTEDPRKAAEILEEAIKAEKPELLLMGATSLGQETAPELGVVFGTGVAAHCVDIQERSEGRLAYMVPAFGGKVIGEIFIPTGRPAIATVKPGVFTDEGWEEIAYRTWQPAGKGEETALQGFRLIGMEEKQQQKRPLETAGLIFCGGFGLGGPENWEKMERLADLAGAGAGCTRPVIDMGWGPDEDAMIGTSGKTVRPKVYVGFGISGSTHHLCGIKDAGLIISINNDREAEVFAASDYKGVMDARAVIDHLLERIGGK